jgi:hypothetical protein
MSAGPVVDGDQDYRTVEFEQVTARCFSFACRRLVPVVCNGSCIKGSTVGKLHRTQGLHTKLKVNFTCLS